MSSVFRAHDERLGRDVAFKLLSPRLAFSREIVARFVNEARTLARLDCPHIVRVLDAGVTNDAERAPLPYMVLELLHGEDLRYECERGAVPSVRRALSWILQACEGLAAAHAEGVIHRDLKPENLFLTRELDGTEVLKVLDFGIARSLAMGPPSLTYNGEGVGSPGYMSPEQLRDASAADERSDIWSLGVVLYELLAGAPPFHAESTFDVCTQIASGLFPRLKRARNDLPRGLAGVVHRCLMVDPDARFANVAELAEALIPYCPELAEEAALRIRVRLAARSSGTPETRQSGVVDVRAPTELAARDEIAVPLARSVPRARRVVSRVVVGLSLAAGLTLAGQAILPKVAHADSLANEARGVMTRAGERVSQAARDLWQRPND